MKILKQNLTVLFFLLITVSVNSQILQVPADYTTIQSAINAAEELDTVLVDEGRYYENINFRGKNIVVASKYILDNDTTYISNTIIDGSRPIHADSASCVMFYESGDSLAVLEGFTLTGGTGSTFWLEDYGVSVIEGGGVLLGYSMATIKNNIIDSNSIKNDGGGGISSLYGKPTIINNIIMNNSAIYAAGLVLNWSDGIIKNNIIYHNKKTGSKWLTGGLMVWDTPGNPIIENNTIIGNTSSTEAGGISVTSASNPIIRNNIIWANRQSYGDQSTGLKTENTTYCNFESPVAGEGNTSNFPLFTPNAFTLSAGSPCIDSGAISGDYNDIENTLLPGEALTPSMGSVRNDMGAFGGPGASVLNMFHVEDFYTVSSISFGRQYVGDSINKKFEILNVGTSTLGIDSITLKNNLVSIVVGNEIESIPSLKNDSVTIKWKATSIGEFVDTLKIYHSLKDIENPKKIIITGEGKAQPVSNINKIQSNTNKLNVSPNPCLESSLIRYSIEKESLVDLGVYSINGAEVRTLVNGQTATGNYEYEFCRQGLRSGVYFIRLVSNGNTSISRLIIK